MPRPRQLTLYIATFGSMTAAAAVIIALIVLSGSDDDGDRDGSRGATVPAVVAEQSIPAGTEISEGGRGDRSAGGTSLQKLNCDGRELNKEDLPG
jgi:hypothetical protein